MLKRIVSLTLAIAAFTVITGLVQANTAKAEVVVVNKVEICHSRQPQPSNGNGAGAQGNPYGPSKLDVSVASIFSANGHDVHNGAVFNGTGQDFWGDIIPPFYYEEKKGKNTEIKFYAGMNWTSEGQALYAKDCQFTPSGTSNYMTECEELTINAPSGVKPQGTSYQYKLDGKNVSIGTTALAPGTYTLTLIVNGTIVDTDTIVIVECDNEEPTPDTSVTAVCLIDEQVVRLTFTNSGTGESTVEVNGESETVPADETITVDLPITGPVVNVTVIIDDVTIDGVTVTCPTGGSGGNGETPTTPTTPVTVVVNGGSAAEVVSLPVTSGSSDKIASIAAMIGATLATAAGYVVRARNSAQL